mgnify:CR=1 FL=1
MNALFFVLIIDFDDWQNDYQVSQMYDVDTITKVYDTLMNRWHGSQRNANYRDVRIVGFKSDVWTVAAMFDPYYTPSRQDYADVIDNGVLNYVISISNLMTPYLDADNLDANMLMMEEEINNIVMRRGRWGDLIETFQRSLPKQPENYETPGETSNAWLLCRQLSH